MLCIADILNIIELVLTRKYLKMIYKFNMKGWKPDCRELVVKVKYEKVSRICCGVSPISQLGETPVAQYTLLLLHGAAEDDADWEDEDGEGDPQGGIVILQLTSTVSTVSPENIYINYIDKVHVVFQSPSTDIAITTW